MGRTSRLSERGPQSADVWPEYNHHGDVFGDWWDPLPDELPESGESVLPAGLASLCVDRAADRATYWEPNVWMVHPELTP